MMDLSKDWYRSEFILHEDNQMHRPLEAEFNFYDAVAEGDLAYVEDNIKRNAFTDPKGMGQLSHNPLQNMRYHFVVTTSMITRYCIHAGMEQERAYGLSDFYILKMDSCQSIQQIGELHDVMCMDFCERMNIIRSSQILSKPIVLCIDYIYSHIHNRITIEELADYLNLSKTYLSKLFVKEMGLPVSRYIQDLKIEKAKNLLQYSNYHIIDIANYLSFSSQSHFIQTFKKKTGLTPHRFRMQNFRSNWEDMSFV